MLLHIGDKALDPVAPFSGGEKARLVLAMLVYQKPNLLLLDEPTNHLDLEMRHALVMALQSFDGAMVTVSHDRHLLKNTADEFYLVDSGEVRQFGYDLDAYYQWLTKANQEQKQTQVEPDKANSSTNRKEQKRKEAEFRKHVQPLKKAIDKLEKQLDTLAPKLADIESQLSDNSVYEEQHKERLKQLLAQQSDYAQQQEAAEEQLLEHMDELEQQEQAFYESN